MEDFEKELELWIGRAGFSDKDSAWVRWRADFTKFIKDKLLQSYRNGHKAGQVAKSPATAKPYPHPSR